MTQHSQGRRAPSCVCSLQLHLKSRKVTGSLLFLKATCWAYQLPTSGPKGAHVTSPKLESREKTPQL